MDFLQLPEIKLSLSFDKNIKKSDLHNIKTSIDCANILRHAFDPDTFHFQEEFIMLCLNRSNKVLGFSKISKGGITGTVADPRIILTIALNCVGTTSIILAHNHPSGNLQPSRADEEITQKIKGAAQYLDIKVLDHLILNDLNDVTYYSFADEGMI